MSASIVHDPPLFGFDGRDWPHRDASRLVEVDGFTWHVQVLGDGPTVVLLHGTGASTHSWRDVAPALVARGLRVVMVDLPGHAFTRAPADFVPTLPAIAAALGRLLAREAPRPAALVGHSAGAAIGARMVLDGHAAPDHLVAVNGAFYPLDGLAGRVMSPLARTVAGSPLGPQLMAWRARSSRFVDDVLRGTGTALDARGLELYARLARRPGHVAGVLAMLAVWRLEPLAADLPRLTRPITLVVAEGDRAVPPAHARRAHAALPRSTLVSWPRLGHLAHEEEPLRLAELASRLVHAGLDPAPPSVPYVPQQEVPWSPAPSS
jgi:magnesium chelatase accessory protein